MWILQIGHPPVQATLCCSLSLLADGYSKLIVSSKKLHEIFFVIKESGSGIHKQKVKKLILVFKYI